MALGTFLSVAGGLKKLFGSKPKPGQQAYDELAGAFKAADDHGLHRLAVAGSPSGYTPVPNHAADGLLQAGEALTQAKQSRKDTSLRRKEEELIDAQIAESRSRTLLNTANSRRPLPPGAPGSSSRPMLGVQGGLEALDKLPSGGPRSVVAEPQRDVPFRQRATLGDTTVTGLNPDLFEIGLSELVTGILMYGPQILAGKLTNAQRNQLREMGLIGDYRRGGKKPKPLPKPRAPRRGPT